MRVLSVFGTRPEAIKMAPLVLALAGTSGFESRVCVTGQHRDMLDDVMTAFALAPDYDLDVMQPDQSLGDVFTAVMNRLDPILLDFQPDCVLVQGDTATSTAAALAAFFRRIKIGHVEAGLRTGNINSPWPEEANRRLTGVIASRHYAPTERARTALMNEGHRSDDILVTGNTVIDALVRVAADVSKPGPLKDGLDAQYRWLDPSKRIILVTGHRRESFGDGLRQICEALTSIAKRDDVHIIYPVHPNPNVREPVRALLGAVPNITLCEPLNYPQFVYLMTRCYLILTDSGGIQEEAPALRKPVLVMRDTSERLEAIEAGVARLVTTDPHLIVDGVTELLTSQKAYDAMSAGASPFGDGKACQRIVQDLLQWKTTFKPSASSASDMSGSQPQQPLRRAASM
jgi:UDP-N-acetylglucosamine 2-epimerase (non-hydrolysing)